jgi:hypothetical protein
MERGNVTQNEQSSANNFHLQQKAVRRGECRSDPEILTGLAQRLGFADRMFPSEEAFFDHLLRPSGLTFEGCPTPLGPPSGRWGGLKYRH